MQDPGIGPLKQNVVAPGGQRFVLELRRLGLAPTGNVLAVALDLAAWIVGRAGGRPWRVITDPDPIRFGADRNIACRTRAEAGAALFGLAEAIRESAPPG